MRENPARIFILLFLTIFFENGCLFENFSFFKNKADSNSQKINNLLDVNGDGQSDLVFWNYTNQNASDFTNSYMSFFEIITYQNTNHQILEAGETGNIPVFGDFTGDGNTDCGVYEYSDGSNRWNLFDGLTMVSFWERFGEVGDLPVQNDYDGDGKCDLVVYRPKNSGFYGLLSDKNKSLEIHLGLTGDIPVPKDYDGDGKADLAVYRESSGTWLIRSSRLSSNKIINLGGPDFLPIPADYNGDGKADLAVWNHKNNLCEIIFSSFFHPKLSIKTTIQIQEKIKNSDCFPASSDFDGDGKCELAFWESRNRLLHVFKLNGSNFNYEKINLSAKNSSIPINFFLLKKFIYRDNKINPSTLTIGGFVKLIVSKGQKLLCQSCKIDSWSSIKQLKSNDIFLADFDGDYVLDSCKRVKDSDKFIFYSTKNKMTASLPVGLESDIPIVGYFNNDSVADLGTFNTSNNKFYINYSLSDNKVVQYQLESKGASKVFVSDFDGDFIDDLGAYNPSAKSLTVRLSSIEKERTFTINDFNDDILSCDFDGDGKSDIGSVDKNSKTLTYVSLISNKTTNIGLDNRINGIPFCSDIDQDLKSDLIFYEPASGIFGFFQSSESYRYDEIYFAGKHAKLVNYIR